MEDREKLLDCGTVVFRRFSKTNLWDRFDEGPIPVDVLIGKGWMEEFDRSPQPAKTGKPLNAHLLQV
ncbi:MAG: hypothetical protein ACLPPF_13295 [Rhodomicrobium sp.]